MSKHTHTFAPLEKKMGWAKKYLYSQQHMQLYTITQISPLEATEPNLPNNIELYNSLTCCRSYKCVFMYAISILQRNSFH